MGAQYTGPAESNERGRSLSRRLADGPPLRLDGAMGTELERRGLDCALPLWSAAALLEAPDIVRAIHAESVAAGAEVLTANTFRTQRRTLRHAPGRGAVDRRAGALASEDDQGSHMPSPERAGDDLARRLTTLAVALAREAAAGGTSTVWVAGSAPPLEDCYRPDLTPPRPALEREHREHAALLRDAGVDLILVETHNTLDECLVAGRAASETGLPWIASFVSWEPGRLLSGEPLADALEAVARLAPSAVGVNCLPPAAVRDNLDVLRQTGLPFAAWANLGAPTAEGRSAPHTPEAFAREAMRWVDAGARMVGGCCGTTSRHIRAIAQRLSTRVPVANGRGSPRRSGV